MKFAIVPVTHYQQNCSIIWCEETKAGAFVDPGGDAATLLAGVKQLDINIEKILVTHGHLDHVGAVAELAETLNLPIEGPHKADAFWINGAANQAKHMGFDAGRSFVPTRWLEDGDSVVLGNQQLDVLHCPGHTPGHVVFYHKGIAQAWVGDVLFAGSIGRTDFPQSDHAALIHAITQKLFPLGDDIQFVPGHGPMSTFGQERKTNPFVADKNFG